MLVTDHHLPGAELPDANVIVNPNLPGSSFGSRALAGVGVAFYVLAALQRLLQEAGPLARAEPAGVAPGSTWWRWARWPTGAARCQQSRAGGAGPAAHPCRPVRCRHRALAARWRSARGSEVVAADLGFAVGPRLNAAGRLDDMSIGIRCLLGDEQAEVRQLAAQLDQLNRQRREIEAADAGAGAWSPVSRPAAAVRTASRHAGLCLFDAGWHQGVVGLVASRIKDRTGRPVIAFAPAGDGRTLRGSARSIAGVHIRDVLDSVATRHPGLIKRFGGHAMAAGLTHRGARTWTVSPAPSRKWWPSGCAMVGAGRRGVDGWRARGSRDLRWPPRNCCATAGPWGQAFPEPVFDGEFEVE